MLKITLVFLFYLPIFVQNIDIQELTKEIYLFNNNGEYKKSQEKLITLLDNKSYSNADKAAFSIILSYTYKRLFDYTSTIKYLNDAEKYANNSGEARDSLVNSIYANKAFVLFDTHKYADADKIMQKLNKLNYKYLAADDLPKINMQEAYLFFLDKKYDLAKRKYDVALKNMLKVSPYDAPMILVKQMELFSEMKNVELRDKYYEMAMASADSFKITKYKMYATEELLRIFKKNKDLKNTFLFQARLDSLNASYKIEENLAGLHSQKTDIVAAEKDIEMSNRTWLLGGGILALVGLLFFGSNKLLKYKSDKKEAEIELENMKIELNKYTSKYILQKNETIKNLDNSSIKSEDNLLNERQKEVLKFMYEGLSNREIADKLFISENTVKYHIKNIYTLLNLNDRSDVVRYFKK